MRKYLLPFAFSALLLGNTDVAEAVTIYGNQTGGNYPGIYTISSEGGQPEEVWQSSGLASESNTTGVFTDDAYYSTFSSTYQKYCSKAIHNADFSEWEMAPRPNDKMKITDIPTALGWNPIDGKVYGSFMTAESGVFAFGTFSTTSATSSIIAPLEKQLVSIAINIDGEMYAIDVDGDLYTFTTKGVFTLVGNTGMKPSAKRSSGAAFDSATGTLYWTMTDKSNDTSLYTVDTTTGKATEVYAYPYGTYFPALIIPEAPAPDGAPADVTDFLALADGFEDLINISFTLPSKTQAGEDMLGAVKYKVYVDTELIANTQGGPGQEVKLSDSPGAGEHTVSLFISNLAGKGNKVSSIVFVGEDTPQAVTNIKIAADGKTITLTWNAPVVGEHGGNFDIEKLRYKVIRLNDDETVAEDLDETTFSETVEAEGLTKYSYSVTPRCGDLSGPAADSPILVVGDGMTPPYEQSFDDPDSFDDIYFSTYDANDDGSGWTLYKNYYGTAGNARYIYSATNDADDWLFTCPLALEGNFKYDLSFTLTTNRWGEGERLGVFYGTLPTPDAMTETALDYTDYEKGFNDTVTASIDPKSSGSYYVGFHITSGKDSYNVDLDNLKIGVGVPTGVSKTIMGNDINVVAGKGSITIVSERDADYVVSDLAGRIVKAGTIKSGGDSVALNTGIYLVKIGRSAYKVIVK
ncbi:MAG: T9SS type A sorting domain-containing protein [Muribaculaceae bacterium]|nr:T9SS type A sorting domain-containing protein [Muribaculaceae bacterium]